jgi:hypothetical protein
MHIAPLNPSPRSRRRPSRSRCVALLASVIASCCALPAAAAVASPSSGSATLSVNDANGKAAELLHRLTIPQVAAVLKTTPAQLAAQIEAPNGSVSLELGELLINPRATLQEVLNLLAAHGISPAPVEQLVNRLLAGVSESPEQLRATVDEVLADVREDGLIPELAKELVLPPAVVEGAHLLPSTVERVAAALNSSTERLSSVLSGAGAATQPLLSTTPLVVSPLGSLEKGSSSVERATSELLGMPNGSGGLSLTTVNSSTTTAGAPAAAAFNPPISNAFSIVSIKVTKAGLILETVNLPNSGQLAINASASKKVAVKSRRGKKRTFTRKATVASVATAVSSGVHTLTLRPRGAASREPRLLVTLATTYTPTGGSPNTIRRSVTVRHAVKKKHR